MSYWKPGNDKPSESRNEILHTHNSANNENGSRMATSTAENINNQGITLSKSVLSMKFMKRRGEVHDDSDEISKRRKYLECQWTNEVPTSNNSGTFTCIRDDDEELALMPGRRSFGGFNIIVEKQYNEAIDITKPLNKKSKKENLVIDDEEMTKRYEQLVGLPRGPNQGKLVPLKHQKSSNK